MKKQRDQTSNVMDSKDHQWDFRNIMKDIEFLGASHITWKERKDLENRRVVSLGGKPPKKQRLPLSVAYVQKKKQEEREEKILQENMILGRLGDKFGGSAKRLMGTFKPEDRVLRSSEGYFRNGILDMKHLLNAGPSRDNDSSNHMVSKAKMKKGRKEKPGKEERWC